MPSGAVAATAVPPGVLAGRDIAATTAAAHLCPAAGRDPRGPGQGHNCTLEPALWTRWELWPLYAPEYAFGARGMSSVWFGP